MTSRDVTADTERDWQRALGDLLVRTQFGTAGELPQVVAEVTAALGVETCVYLVDLEQRELRPLPIRGRAGPGPLSVEGTLAGRAFTETRTKTVAAAGERRGRLWVPLVDGTERLGVVGMRLGEGVDPRADDLQEQCEIFAELVGHLVASKLPYGDALHQVRRTRQPSPAAELVMALLPPLTFTCDRLVVSASLEPAYNVGGDAFDYAVDNGYASVMILDAMGREMFGAITSAVALSALRSARREGKGLYAMARAADDALLAAFDDRRFVTGVLAELDLGTGAMRYLNAGHWPALILRRGKFVRSLDAGRRLPLGLEDVAVEVAEEALEPGDHLLLYTDGITEARTVDGERFGLTRLIDLAERHAADGLPAPEKLRRLTRSVLEHQGGAARDDATMLLVEWSAEAATNALSLTAARRLHS